MTEGERIKALRAEMGIKQGDFAKKICITQGHLSDIENGRKSLTDRTIQLICTEFNASEDWIRFGTGDMFNELTADEELAIAMAELSNAHDEFVISFIKRYWKLDEHGKAAVRQMLGFEK